MTHEFHQDAIDKFVATLTNAEVYQIILDHDELERKGKIGDCLLRSTTERWIETVPYPGISFVIYMGYIANACHKRRSLQLLQIEGAVTTYNLALDM